VRFRMVLIGRASGLEVVNEASSVYTVRDGRVARIEYYYDDAEARAALEEG
jgi:ketosteroid isomerase-like protein